MSVETLESNTAKTEADATTVATTDPASSHDSDVEDMPESDEKDPEISDIVYFKQYSTALGYIRKIRIEGHKYKISVHSSGYSVSLES